MSSLQQLQVIPTIVEYYKGEKNMYRNPEKRKKYVREWNRKNVLMTTINGKIVRLRIKKRISSGFCELCNKKCSSHLQWHHWDDTHPEIGMWLCLTCHPKVEFYESGMIFKYKELKKYLESR